MMAQYQGFKDTMQNPLPCITIKFYKRIKRWMSGGREFKKPGLLNGFAIPQKRVNKRSEIGLLK
ncbi:hypothetical protein GCM10027299_20800 [Larkinella ripae]